MIKNKYYIKKGPRLVIDKPGDIIRRYYINYKYGLAVSYRMLLPPTEYANPVVSTPSLSDQFKALDVKENTWVPFGLYILDPEKEKILLSEVDCENSKYQDMRHITTNSRGEIVSFIDENNAVYSTNISISWGYNCLSAKMVIEVADV